MNDELDEYGLFLEDWEAGSRLKFATLPPYLSDPVASERVWSDSTTTAPLERQPFVEGYKDMDDLERSVRKYDFFEKNQGRWAREFKDYVTSHGVPESKFDTYTRAFVNDWVDGLKRRQFSPEISSVKASIQLMDRDSYGSNTGAFVDNHISTDVNPLFTSSEMRTIFNANSGLIESFMADYISHLDDDNIGSLSELFVRRGVYMSSVGEFRRELHYLSSYSLGLQTVEQFAQTWTSSNRDLGKPTIFSAPISAVQDRVVAFAPFIADMDLRQLELVVAPPTEATPLRDHGPHAGIREYSFL